MSPYTLTNDEVFAARRINYLEYALQRLTGDSLLIKAALHGTAEDSYV